MHRICPEFRGTLVDFEIRAVQTLWDKNTGSFKWSFEKRRLKRILYYFLAVPPRESVSCRITWKQLWYLWVIFRISFILGAGGEGWPSRNFFPYWIVWQVRDDHFLAKRIRIGSETQSSVEPTSKVLKLESFGNRLDDKVLVEYILHCINRCTIKLCSFPDQWPSIGSTLWQIISSLPNK